MLCEKDKFSCEHRSLQEFPNFNLHFTGFVSYMSNIQNMSLEDIMGERFGRYSKYIIQDRALPDIRDGLKPVQRRILYSMNKDGNTFDKSYRKSAKSVGNIMGISTHTVILLSMMLWFVCHRTGRIVRF